MRIAPVQTFLQVGFWASQRTIIQGRFSVQEGRLSSTPFQPGHIVVRQDRVLWNFRVVHLQLGGGAFLGEPTTGEVEPPEPIDRQWPSDTLPEIQEPDLEPNSCDCQTDIQWVRGTLFDMLV